jgi:hypothetical protein
LLLACVLPTMATAAGPAPTTPEIRMTAANQVPRCVTPDRLMAYLKSRNASLDPRFADIAQWYRRHGEAWRVRWDYAFYQMAIETNFLTYKRGDGRMGDVDPRQNNFAGIGTTGGGVPGDRYGDVGTGVLAQIQHLVAYSGEKLAAPVAPRTQLKQDDIVSVSRKLNRPVRFGDLAGRWAVDRNYARSIEWVAEQFRSAHCKGGEIEAKPAGPATPQVAAAGKPKVARLAAAGAAPTLPAQPSPAPRPPAVAAPEAARPPPSPAAARSAPACTVASASYGGSRSVLIRSEAASGVRFTVLSVLPGFERSMTEGYIRKHLGEGAPVGEFESREAALARARELCAGA